MKILLYSPQPECQNKEVQILSDLQLPDRVPANALHVPDQQKCSLYIEQTIAWSSRSEGLAGKQIHYKVSFQKPPSKSQDKQYRVQALLEIFSRR